MRPLRPIKRDLRGSERVGVSGIPDVASPEETLTVSAEAFLEFLDYGSDTGRSFYSYSSDSVSSPSDLSADVLESSSRSISTSDVYRMRMNDGVPGDVVGGDDVDDEDDELVIDFDDYFENEEPRQQS